MSYSDDAVRAKLSSLNETQDSIVAVAQWIMFHRRHADRTAQLWLARLQDAPVTKRLNLVYLANEVVQQSRARSRTDFLYAFEPLIAEATATAYKGASVEVQNKLKRVVEVWRQRNIFDPNIQSAIEKRVEELDRLRGGGGGANGIGKAKLGGSLFGNSGGSVPAELQDISKASTAIARAEMHGKTAIPNAEAEYEKMNDPSVPSPTPPVHAARLNSLMKSLASAQSALEGCIKARTDIVAGLEKLLDTHRDKLATEQGQLTSVQTRMVEVEAKKKGVEDQIMQALSTPDATTPVQSTDADMTNKKDDTSTSTGAATRPEPDSFTPPPPEVEAFTPPTQPEDVDEDTFALGDADPREACLADTSGAELIHEIPPNLNEPPPSYEPPHIDLLHSLSKHVPGAAKESVNDPRTKRRKVAHTTASGDVDDAVFGETDMGVDEDGVAALLGN